MGGGDSAMEEANYLTKFASKVHLLHRRDGVPGSKIMIDRTYDAPQDRRPHQHRGRAEVLGDAKVEALKIRDTGHRRGVASSRWRACSSRSATSRTPTCSRTGSTSTRRATSSRTITPRSRIDGVFIAGDVHDHRYRQAVTAAGDGCKAAIDAERWLEHEGLAEHQTATAW